MPYPTRREAAVRVLLQVTQNTGYTTLALQGALKKLPPDQRAFVTELVYGVLRNLLYLDYALNLHAHTPTGKMKPFILNTLRAAAYQLLFMSQVPGSAACNEAVAMTRAAGFPTLTGFVNGVLRALARSPAPEPSGEGRLSLRYSHPQWILDLWREEFSPEEVEAICAADQLPPPVSLCVNTTRATPAQLAEALEAAGAAVEPGKLLPNALGLRHGPELTGLEAFRRGWFFVMDQGAMLAVDTLDPQPGETLLDLCAAPGGKSFYAAIKMRGQGRVLARDLHPRRLALVTEGADRLGLPIVETALSDAGVFQPALENIAHRLLIDAPCSGLGLLRKKPDARYSKTPADVAALAALQRKILAASWRYVKPGGLLVYCTCTLSPPENGGNFRWFLQNYPFRPVGEPIQLTPGDATDGFFICKLQRSEDGGYPQPNPAPA
jgi:16S rRNA (cytosine967-C5)-methyltransferase